MKNESKQIEIKQVVNSSNFELVELDFKKFEGRPDAIQALDEICELILLKILLGFISKTQKSLINHFNFSKLTINLISISTNFNFDDK